MTPTDPTVRALVQAINDGDREAFLGLLSDGATMSDDGDARDLTQWIDREIFAVNGHMDVVSESVGGHELVADFENDTWGRMQTVWRFTIAGGRIDRFETGQA